MRRFLLGPVFLLVFVGSALAALSFPALTGRVVDEAGILSGQTRQNLEQLLADYETQTTNQVVVVTLKSLQGTTIEDYGYQLGRTWGIGQKGKDNGVLLIVAPSEHKVRIEVGYGLEGTLTDALSSQIIQGIILPDFRAGHMEQGVTEGTNAIIATLKGEPYTPSESSVTSADPDPSNSRDEPNAGDLIASILILGLFCILFVRACWYNPTALLAASYIGGRSFGGGIGGGFGGGFSGGGGGFGGGGASGGW